MVVCAPGTELFRLVDEDVGSFDLGALRHVVSAGESLNPVVAQRWERASGVPVAEAYGFNKVVFGIIMILNLEIGFLTPPVGLNLLVAMSTFKQKFGELIIAATPFTDSGAIDFDSIDTLTDFYLSFGIDGLTILGIMGEAQKLSQDESLAVMHRFLERVDGRVPVIVTTTHFGTQVCAERCRHAQDLGAAMVMVMPPYHGATFRCGEAQVHEFYTRVSDAIDIPIIKYSVEWWNTLHQGSSVSLKSAPTMAMTMFTGMIVMALACWAYAIAASLWRVRCIILERERRSDWVTEFLRTRP